MTGAAQHIPLISSTANPQIKAALRLRKRRQRDREKLFFIEGTREIARALDAGRELVTVFASQTESGAWAASEIFEREGFPGPAHVLSCSREVLDRLAYRPDHDGIVALGRQWSQSLEELQLGRVPLLFVAVGIEKPGNLGALFRIADSAGVDALVLCDPATDSFNPNVVRSSLGTICSVPFTETSSRFALEWLRSNDIRVAVASPEGTEVCWDADFTQPVALVIGSECFGAGQLWIDAADALVAIPQRGNADSMNAAISAAVLGFEAQRQRTAENNVPERSD